MTSVDQMRTILNGMVDRLPPQLSGADLGEVLDHLIYLTDDNGSDLVAVCREWLAGEDVRRIEAALSVSELFLYDSKEKLAGTFRPLATRWPQLSERVEEILQQWDRQQEANRQTNETLER